MHSPTSSGTTGTYSGVDKRRRSSTGRSRSENQERAYVAASRRTDRSLAARLQSAQMASEIHKQRTGKSLLITESIVLNEDMYEEEDELAWKLSRRSSSYCCDAKIGSPENKSSIADDITAVHIEWRQNAINQLFARTFSNMSTPPSPNMALEKSQNLDFDLPAATSFPDLTQQMDLTSSCSFTLHNDDGINLYPSSFVPELSPERSDISNASDTSLSSVTTSCLQPGITNDDFLGFITQSDRSFSPFIYSMDSGFSNTLGCAME